MHLTITNILEVSVEILTKVYLLFREK